MLNLTKTLSHQLEREQRRTAQVVRRLDNIGHYLGLIRAHPLGFMPKATASRFLGISSTRLAELIGDGRVAEVVVLAESEGGNDAMVCVESLIRLPSMAREGQRLRTLPEQMPRRKHL